MSIRPGRDSPDRAPIGVFDSGLGGLSVLREVRRHLPSEDLIYVADSGHAPYGDRSREYIDSRATAMADFLLSQGVKAMVVACNTATAVSVERLRVRLAIPVVAIEPAVKPAAARTRSGVVGVLATSRTLSGTKFANLVAEHAGGVTVLAQACPGLVERVEAGDLRSAETRALVERYVLPLVAEGADTLVLGCTHYPFLRPLVQEVVGPAVVVLDSAVAVAQQLCRRLEAEGSLRLEAARGREWFWTTGAAESVEPVARMLWDGPAEFRTMPAAVSGAR